jgi:hypothetical protein
VHGSDVKDTVSGLVVLIDDIGVCVCACVPARFGQVQVDLDVEREKTTRERRDRWDVKGTKM